MSEWWEKPYPQGEPVPVVGFPRPVYPPDAALRGKTPSVAGADVEAYKRAIWRGGRWPGPASNFDRSFSNGFAHGTGGNVGETGLAGFQRQSGIDDTGWLGRATFDAIRSSLVPPGRPNSGQPLLDALALNLIAEAWAAFDEPPPPPTSAETRLEEAIRWLGYKESPPGSNATTFGQWYGVNYQPWCAIAVTYWDQNGGSPSRSFVRGAYYAYVPYIVSDARAKRNGLSVPSTPKPGDLVCYDWDSPGGSAGSEFDHVGLFEDWAGGSPSQFTAIEGNTSTSNDSNGGEVMRRSRDTRNQATVFVRVAEP